ncbi:MAG: hypothetical protein HY978_04830 [Candidatus Liptonbacteria bacterium]|nr:hypothetical protein [Candidatus Liptonbacteria bacterium]
MVKPRELKHKKRLNIYPAPPFHFDGTFHKPSHFPATTEDWEPGKFWQTIRLGNKLLGLKIEKGGFAAKPQIRVTVYSGKPIVSTELENIRRELIYRNELDNDLKQFRVLTARDKRFAPIFRRWQGMRNATSDSLYKLLIISVVLQNATVRRSVQMLTALLERYGDRVQFDKREFYAIWLPERMAGVGEDELRALKVGYRAKFIKRLSADMAAGLVDEQKLRGLDTDTIKKELLRLYGVGPETVRILLFEVFHRSDAFIHIAPWQQKIYSRLFYKKKLMPAARIQRDIQKQYGQYAMLAVHYIWEDIFWRRRHEHIPWLEEEIRL